MENNNNDTSKVMIPGDQLHWYQWMKQASEKPVSQYLHQKHKNIQKILEKRRIERIKRKSQWIYYGDNLKKMNKKELHSFAQERDLEIPKEINSKTLPIQRKWIIQTLRERERINWQKAQPCAYDKCNKNKNLDKFKCQHCNAAFYCSSKCRRLHYKKHRNKCSKLYGALRSKEAIDHSKIFPPPDEIENLREEHKSNKSKSNNSTLNNDNIAYLEEYPQPKSWFDLDFELFNSDLSRLQQRCSCRSGVQLPGCCAHCGCIIRLIWHILHLGKVDQLLKKNKRDIKIEEKIINLFHFSEELKANAEKYKYICLCCSSAVNKKKKNSYKRCGICYRRYHLTCTQSMNIHRQSKFIQTVWHCPLCTSQDSWCVRNS